AADHLLDGALALGRAELAAEVLLRDDVGRVLRPALRELDVALLERDAVAMADTGVAQLPLDCVERVLAGRREMAFDGQRASGRSVVTSDRVRGWVHRPSPPLRRRGEGPPGLLFGPRIVPRGPDGTEDVSTLHSSCSRVRLRGARGPLLGSRRAASAAETDP